MKWLDPAGVNNLIVRSSSHFHRTVLVNFQDLVRALGWGGQLRKATSSPFIMIRILSPGWYSWSNQPRFSRVLVSSEDCLLRRLIFSQSAVTTDCMIMSFEKTSCPGVYPDIVLIVERMAHATDCSAASTSSSQLSPTKVIVLNMSP